MPEPAHAIEILKTLYPRANKKSRAWWNKVIRNEIRGAGELLATIEKVSLLRHTFKGVQDRDILLAVEDDLQCCREYIVDYLKADVAYYPDKYRVPQPQRDKPPNKLAVTHLSASIRLLRGELDSCNPNVPHRRFLKDAVHLLVECEEKMYFLQ